MEYRTKKQDTLREKWLEFTVLILYPIHIGIIFTGIAERENLKNYYAAGDIFVYASKSETQGMIITEAMYMGLPIVAVKATGIESLVENNVNGILTPAP